MIEKAQGFVPCTHCNERRADTTCRSCGHLVCGVCAVDAERCPDRRPDHLRPGLFVRVLHVDAAGRHALVVNMLGTCWVYDLQQHKRLAAPYFATGARSRLRRGEREPRSCVLPSGQVAHLKASTSSWASPGEDWKAYSGGARTRVDGVRVRTPGRKDKIHGGSGVCAHPAWVVPGGVFDAGGRYVYSISRAPGDAARFLRRQNTVDVIEPSAGRLVGTIAPKLRITAAAACGQTKLLALALAEADDADEAHDALVQLYSLESLQPRGEPVYLPTRVTWIGLGCSALVAVVRERDGWALSLRGHFGEGASKESGADAIDLIPQRPLEALSASLPLDGIRGPLEASLAQSGAHLALRCGPGKVALVDLVQGVQQVLEVGMRKINVVRFVDQDRRLVVAGSEIAVFHFRRGRFVT